MPGVLDADRGALGASVMNAISVQFLFENCLRDFEFEVLTPSLRSEVDITTSDVNRPGLALAGFTENFLAERIQIIGQTEILYLSRMTESQCDEALQRLFSFRVPCVIVAKGLDPPARMLELASEKQVPVLRTPMSTTPFIHELTVYLDNLFAQETSLHGSLMDVYGVGLLFTGASGIGKSECALDLVERGHRLVADDVVRIRKRHEGILIGMASDLLRHHMEIRGLGIIDVQAIFGIRAIRGQKRVEVEVHLKEWEDTEQYERTGLDEKTSTILGVQIPLVIVPIVPGKNLTVIAEVIALNYLVKAYGYNPAERLNDQLRDLLARRRHFESLARGDLE
jgi:HPr kinase/phosphorylase